MPRITVVDYECCSCAGPMTSHSRERRHPRPTAKESINSIILSIGFAARPACENRTWFDSRRTWQSNGSRRTRLSIFAERTHFLAKSDDPPPGCKGMPGPPCGPKKSKKRCSDNGKGNDFNHCKD